MAIACLFQHSPSLFLARSASGILTIDAMRGKRIMMFSTHQGATLRATRYH